MCIYTRKLANTITQFLSKTRSTLKTKHRHALLKCLNILPSKCTTGGHRAERFQRDSNDKTMAK